ncbi:MAG: hypothetical protein HC820_08335 [Hydrococcus sp. RM1_1_31]|nr:hypothetical protein [Hydrococcus sp. RM1_1_31]
MNTIAIALSDERLLKLQKIADDLNVSLEELVLMSLDNFLTQQEVSSPNSATDILSQNAELNSEVIEKIYALAERWKSEVAGISSTAKMSQHPAYQEIISMGISIVPLLLSELKNNPLYWLTALSAITGENPIKPEQRGRVQQMASAWIEWGQQQGYAIEENV